MAQWIAHWTSRGLKGFKGSGFESRRSRVFSFGLVFFFSLPPAPYAFWAEISPPRSPVPYLTAAGIRCAGLALLPSARLSGPASHRAWRTEESGKRAATAAPAAIDRTCRVRWARRHEASSPPARRRSRRRALFRLLPGPPPPSGSGRRALLRLLPGPPPSGSSRRALLLLPRPELRQSGQNPQPAQWGRYASRTVCGK